MILCLFLHRQEKNLTIYPFLCNFFESQAPIAKIPIYKEVICQMPSVSQKEKVQSLVRKVVRIFPDQTEYTHEVGPISQRQPLFFGRLPPGSCLRTVICSPDLKSAASHLLQTRTLFKRSRGTLENAPALPPTTPLRALLNSARTGSSILGCARTMTKDQISWPISSKLPSDLSRTAESLLQYGKLAPATE
jgi:hypothetical protein